MRGGEGHARAIQSCYTTRGDEVTLPFFNDSETTLPLRSGSVTVRQTTSYPYEGAVRLEVLKTSCTTPVTVRFFAPGWLQNQRLARNGRAMKIRKADGFVSVRLIPRAGDVLTLKQDLLIRARDTRNPRSLQNYFVFEAGPLVLGHAGDKTIPLSRNAQLMAVGAGQYKVEGTEILLGRINDLNDAEYGVKDPCSRQILFRAV
jgi:DUF1680 family protein